MSGIIQGFKILDISLQHLVQNTFGTASKNTVNHFKNLTEPFIIYEVEGVKTVFKLEDFMFYEPELPIGWQGSRKV